MVPDSVAAEVAWAIIDVTRTGAVGDGRIFEIPVSAGYTIWIGEREE